MGAGLVFGRKKQSESNDSVYKVVQEFCRDFKKEFGSLNCTNLLGMDLSTPEGIEMYKQKYGDTENTYCQKISAKAAEMLYSIIELERNKSDL